jgi:hypothetical protein
MNDDPMKIALKAKIAKWFVPGDLYDTYVIPADTPLFKSFRKPLTEWAYTPVQGPAYFGFNEETSRIYGYAFSYITKEPHVLLAIDSDKTMDYLSQLIKDEEVKRALNSSFGYNSRGQVRNSVGPNDWKVVQFLCDNGLPGYAANFMQEAIPGSFFHPECVICEPKVRLNDAYSVNGIAGLATPEEFHQEISAKLTKMSAPPRKRKAETNVERIIKPMTLNFGDDDDDTPKSGGSRKRRRQRQKKSRRQIKMATTKYDELFLKLSRSLRDTESAHMIEDKILWLFVSDIANGNLKQDEILQIANKINKVIIEDRKNAGRWFA